MHRVSTRELHTNHVRMIGQGHLNTKRMHSVETMISVICHRNTILLLLMLHYTICHSLPRRDESRLYTLTLIHQRLRRKQKQASCRDAIYRVLAKNDKECQRTTTMRPCNHLTHRCYLYHSLPRHDEPRLHTVTLTHQRFQRL